MDAIRFNPSRGKAAARKLVQQRNAQAEAEDTRRRREPNEGGLEMFKDISFDDDSGSAWRMVAVLALVADALGRIPSVASLHQHGGGVSVTWWVKPTAGEAGAFEDAWGIVDGCDGPAPGSIFHTVENPA
jgi:hypothetical protein